MKTTLRIAIILWLALVAGLLYNHFHPRGVHWPILFHSYYLHASDRPDVEVVSVDSALYLVENPEVFIIDVRIAQDFQLDHIPGAFHWNFQNLLNNPDRFAPGDGIKQVMIYDQEGDLEKLALAASTLHRNVSGKYYILFGGFLAWLDRGYPIEKE